MPVNGLVRWGVWTPTLRSSHHVVNKCEHFLRDALTIVNKWHWVYEDAAEFHPLAYRHNIPVGRLGLELFKVSFDHGF